MENTSKTILVSLQNYSVCSLGNKTWKKNLKKNKNFVLGKFSMGTNRTDMKRRRNKQENLGNRNLSRVPNGTSMVGIGRSRGWPTGTLLLLTLNCPRNAKPRQPVGGEPASEHGRLMNWLCFLIVRWGNRKIIPSPNRVCKTGLKGSPLWKWWALA